MASLTITTIQTNLIWEDKTANLHLLEQKINAIEDKTEIIVLPEMFGTGFSMRPQALETMDGQTVEWMKRVSRENGIILTGSVMIEEAGKYYNRLIWMLPNGQYGYYDKRHLFAFGEEDKQYSPGNKRLIASVKGWKINLLICYDLRFPVWARQAPPSSVDGGETEYDLLIYHSGNSLVIDPLGQVLYHLADEEEVNSITLEKETLHEIRAKFPFWKDADRFNIQ